MKELRLSHDTKKNKRVQVGGTYWLCPLSGGTEKGAHFSVQPFEISGGEEEILS